MEFRHCIIDSSVFVAFYRDVDSLHVEAERIMRELSGETLVVHPYVIQETATVLTYRCGIKIAHQFLADVIAADNIIIPAVDPRYDIDRFMEVDAKMSFTDIALIELARTTGARIITFDRQMLSLT